MLRCGDFAEVDWDSRDEASVYRVVRHFVRGPFLVLAEGQGPTYPTAIPANARPARNMPILTEAV